jgi:cullin 1
MSKPNNGKELSDKIQLLNFYIQLTIDQINSNYKKKVLNNKEYMTVYTTVYNLSILRNSKSNMDLLYQIYNNNIKKFIQLQILDINSDTYVKSSESILSKFYQKYNDFCIFKKWMTRIFIYLERYYIRNKDITKLEEKADQIFQDEYINIQSVIINHMLLLIDKDRNHQICNDQLIHNISEIMFQHKFYNSFEKELLIISNDYYNNCSQKWIPHLVNYLDKVSQLLLEEQKRADKYLFKSTYQKLMDEIFTHLILKNQDTILNDEQYGFIGLLNKRDFNQLQQLFSLNSYYQSGIDKIKNSFSNFIVKKLEKVSITNDKNNDYILELINQFNDLNNICSKYLLNTPSSIYSKKVVRLETLLNTAFIQKIQTINHFSKDLAELSDCYLKNSKKKKTNEEIKDVLKSICKFFTFVDNKDEFIEYYKNLLSYRLINNKSRDFDNEKVMILNFKLTSGISYTSSLEGIINDPGFKNNIQIEYPLNFNTRVLSLGNWCSFNKLEPILPNIMREYIQKYLQQYKIHNSNRKINFNFSLGNCDVVMNIQKKKFILSTSPIQAIVLLLFNNNIKYNLSKIMDVIGLDKFQLNGIIGSLCFGKKKILLKEPNTKKISKSDIFSVNNNFSSSITRIYLPRVKYKHKNISEKININRNIIIDAVIVRIMKSRKVLSHCDLMSNVISQINNFKPSIKHIKHRIEKLINREYLERTEDGYTYLA